MDKFLTADLQNVRRLCERGYYNYIIVGSGIGGGLLARTLFENSPSTRVLVIEQGGLSFTTHCLNTPRPHWNKAALEGPSQDNDIVYQATKEIVNTITSASYGYVGGPVHCIGGRGNVWGLYIPKCHPDEAAKYFPPSICKYLFDKHGYERAYRVLANDPDPDASIDRPYPDNGVISINKINDLIESLNKSTAKWKCHFSCAALAAEFTPQHPESSLYQFPMGAYSPVNWILDRVLNRDERFTILSKTQVLTVNPGENGSISSLTVCDHLGEERQLPIGNSTVILSAGTLGSATIALKSGLGRRHEDVIDQNNLVGKGLIDHDIWGTRLEVLQGKCLKELNGQPLKLQSWVNFGSKSEMKDFVLVNIAVNASTFLGRAEEEWFPTLYLNESLAGVSKVQFEKELRNPMKAKSTIQITYEFTADLEDANMVLNLPEPTTTIQIQRLPDNSGEVEKMRYLARDIGLALAAKFFETAPEGIALGSNRNGLCSCEGSEIRACWSENPFPNVEIPMPQLAKAGFGVVAHEVGTMRMPGRKGSLGVVDENLQVKGQRNLYVCDLSVFPVSPAANPTLTLTALAQRLGDHLEEERKKKMTKTRGGSF